VDLARINQGAIVKKPTDAWDATCLSLQPVRDAWSAAQAQLADALRWTSAQGVQARSWLESTHCSASECARRLLAATSRK
jgi:predicted amino acid dehydrogenase